MPEPKWRQIAEDLREKIESGQLGGCGEDGKPRALPTEAELQTEYAASRNTVRDAIDWLRTRRLVYSRSGQGTFVVERIEPFTTTLSADSETGLGGGEGEAYIREVQAQGRAPRADEPRVEIRQASPAVAAELGIPLRSTVVSRLQDRYIDELPFSQQTSYYPISLVDAGATLLMRAATINPGTVGYLREYLGIRQNWYRDKITVRVPDRPEAAFFKLPEDGSVPVFETFRTAFDDNDKPYRLTVSVFPADRNQFVVNVGAVPTSNEPRARGTIINGVGGVDARA